MKVNELELANRMKSLGLTIRGDQSLESRANSFERALKIVIPPRTQSDRTSWRNIRNWLVDGCRSEKFREHAIFKRVLDFALEASGPASKNPAAVFTYIMKKELNYGRT
jgi:hypothetical protein